MKKILFSLACMVGFVLAITSCKGSDNYYYYSNLTGIYTSETATDSTTVILMPQGSKDVIMMKVKDGESLDSIFITPTITLDNINNVGSFADSETGWTGDFTFANYGATGTLKMTNQITGQTLPVISLSKTQFGNTLAGEWVGTTDPVNTKMSIVLCRPGVADRGTITVDGNVRFVYVIGPDSRYGTGTLYETWATGWAKSSFKLSALSENYEQTIQIARGESPIEMKRVFE